MPVRRNCLICGEEFTISPSRVKRGRGHYCSKECYYDKRWGKSQISHTWSPEAIKLLKEYYPQVGWWAGAFTGHTLSAAQGKARTLGLVKVLEPYRWEWSKEEDAILKEMYPQVSKKAAMWLLGRTESATKGRAGKFKLKVMLAPHQYRPDRDEYWTKKELATLRDMYPQIGSVGCTSFISRTRPAIEKRANINKIKCAFHGSTIYAAGSRKTQVPYKVEVIIREMYPQVGKKGTPFFVQGIDDEEKIYRWAQKLGVKCVWGVGNIPRLTKRDVRVCPECGRKHFGTGISCSRLCGGRQAAKTRCSYAPTILSLSPSGYEILSWPSHPVSDRSGRAGLHRYIAWQKDGYSEGTLEALLSGKLSVHHIDGNRLNNEEDNLELWWKNNGSQPSGQRVVDLFGDHFKCLGWTPPE